MQKFNCLVIEGGSVKGLAYPSAIKVLGEDGMLTDLQYVAGTSAGAICASLIAFGMRPEKMTELLFKTNFNQFKDSSFSMIKNIWNLFRTFGWYRGESFKAWYSSILVDLGINPTIKMGEMGKYGIKYLCVVATNITTKKSVLITPETHPDMMVVDAVRASMSIPGFFSAFKVGDIYYADGGIINNYPISVFDEPRFLLDESYGKLISSYDGDRIYNCGVIGLRVDSRDEIIRRESVFDDPVKKMNIKSYTINLIGLMNEIVNSSHLRKIDFDRTIVIETPSNMSALKFDLTNDDKLNLVDTGTKCAESYLQKFHDPESKLFNKISNN